jgi:hypothetical protein
MLHLRRAEPPRLSPGEARGHQGKQRHLRTKTLTGSWQPAHRNLPPLRGTDTAWGGKTGSQKPPRPPQCIKHRGPGNCRDSRAGHGYTRGCGLQVAPSDKRPVPPTRPGAVPCGRTPKQAQPQTQRLVSGPEPDPHTATLAERLQGWQGAATSRDRPPAPQAQQVPHQRAQPRQQLQHNVPPTLQPPGSAQVLTP